MVFMQIFVLAKYAEGMTKAYSCIFYKKKKTQTSIDIQYFAMQLSKEKV